MRPPIARNCCRQAPPPPALSGQLVTHCAGLLDHLALVNRRLLNFCAKDLRSILSRLFSIFESDAHQ